MYDFIVVFCFVLILITVLVYVYMCYQEWRDTQELRKKQNGLINRLTIDLKSWEEAPKSYRYSGRPEGTSSILSHKSGHFLKKKDGKNNHQKERDQCPQCKRPAAQRIYFCQHVDSKCENGHIWHYINNAPRDTSYNDGEVEPLYSHYLIGSKKSGPCSICQGRRKWYPLVSNKYPVFKYLPITEKSIQSLIKPESNTSQNLCPQCGLLPDKDNSLCKYGCFKCPNLHQWHHEDNLGNIMHECPHCIYKNNDTDQGIESL